MLKFVALHRRAVVGGLVLIVPLLTWLAAEGVAQMRLAHTMTDAATRLLGELRPEQKARLNLQFESRERFSWHYIPRMRKGLALRELTKRQKELALDLLRTGLGARGFDTAEKIRSLEPILIEREKNGSMPMVRDPEGYFVVIFGTPSRERPWGWRFEGHHISVNFTVTANRVEDKVLSNTPLFFGAEPDEVLGGPLKGLRPLGAVEDAARALMGALDAGQRKEAIVSTQLPVDIFSGNHRDPDLGSQLNPMGLQRQPDRLQPEGLAAGRMTARQKELLKALVDAYLARMPEEIVAWRSREVAADFDSVHFAWIGATRAEDAPKPTASFGCEPGDTRWECMPYGFPYYYRVQGPTFLIEYMNTNGNHGHSVWRDFQNGDFGEDLLRAHYMEVPHDGMPRIPLLAAR